MPKSRGGKETIPLHPICHRFIHRTIANKVLERDYACVADLRAHPEIARFIDWVSAKDPDFSAPTRKRQR